MENLIEYNYRAKCGHKISLGYMNKLLALCMNEYFKNNIYFEFCDKCKIEINEKLLRGNNNNSFFSGKCCDKAVKFNGNCVCSYQTKCVDHGIRCNGSHD